jgi:hypothetical protein
MKGYMLHSQKLSISRFNHDRRQIVNSLAVPGILCINNCSFVLLWDIKFKTHKFKLPANGEKVRIRETLILCVSVTIDVLRKSNLQGYCHVNNFDSS